MLAQKKFTIFLLLSVVRILILRMTYPLYKLMLHNWASEASPSIEILCDIYMSVCMFTYLIAGNFSEIETLTIFASRHENAKV